MILDVYKYCMCMCVYIYIYTLYQLSGEKSPFSSTPCIYLCILMYYTYLHSHQLKDVRHQPVEGAKPNITG